jgi:transposase
MKHNSLLNIAGVGRTYAAKIALWQKDATFADETEWVSEMIVADAQRTLVLREQIRALDAKIEVVAEQSPMATTLRTITGFGPVCSATLAGEIGNIERFDTEASLALYIGMTRLDNSSGTYVGTKNTRQVNTHARGDDDGRCASHQLHRPVADPLRQETRRRKVSQSSRSRSVAISSASSGPCSKTSASTSTPSELRACKFDRDVHTFTVRRRVNG